jgi:hypothetical protein
VTGDAARVAAMERQTMRSFTKTTGERQPERM